MWLIGRLAENLCPNHLSEKPKSFQWVWYGSTTDRLEKNLGKRLQLRSYWHFGKKGLDRSSLCQNDYHRLDAILSLM